MDKKLFCYFGVVLTLCLMFALPGMGEDLSANGFNTQAFSEAYDSSKLSLKKLDFPGNEDIEWMSVSPQGSYLLGRKDADIGIYHIASQAFIPLNVDYSGDENHCLKSMLSSFAMNGVQVSWAPNEQYFVLTNHYEVMQRNGYWDLILGNIHANTLSVVKSWERSVFAEDYGRLYQACFDANSTKIYYSRLGQKEQTTLNSKYLLESYDLATGQIATLSANEWTDETGENYRCTSSELYCLGDGRLVQLAQPERISSTDWGLRVLTPAQDEWKSSYIPLAYDDARCGSFRLRKASDDFFTVQYTATLYDKTSYREQNVYEEQYVVLSESNRGSVLQIVRSNSYGNVIPSSDGKYFLALAGEGRNWELCVYNRKTGTTLEKQLRLTGPEVDTPFSVADNWRPLSGNTVEHRRFVDGILWGGNILLMQLENGVGVYQFNGVETVYETPWHKGIDLTGTAWHCSAPEENILTFCEERTFEMRIPTENAVIRGRYTWTANDTIVLIYQSVQIDGELFDVESKNQYLEMIFRGSTLQLLSEDDETVVFFSDGSTPRLLPQTDYMSISEMDIHYASPIAEAYAKNHLVLEEVTLPNAQDIKWISISPSGSYLLGCCNEQLGIYHVKDSRFGSYSFGVRIEDRITGETASASSGAITVTQAACMHPGTTNVKLENRDEYIKLSDSKHTIRSYYNVVCTSCQEIQTTIYKDATENHTYANGNCIYCGSADASPCSHPEYRSIEQNQTVRNIDSDSSHLLVTLWKDVCTKCGMTLNLTRETTVSEAHRYSGQTCTVCGFVRRDGCDHADRQKEYLGNTTEIVDATKHLVISQYRVTCTDCGILLDANYEEEAYFSHTFENNMCKHCGYKKTQAQVCPVYGNAHVLDYQGYEAKHETEYASKAHKIFRRCKCGYAEYTGGTMTSLDKSVCCYCGNHQFGPSYADGNLLKRKCNNCSETIVIGNTDNKNETLRPTVTPNKDCTVTGIHTYTQISYSKEHPHAPVSAKCKCGAVSYNVSARNGSFIDCCKCGNHSWGSPVASSSVYYVYCSRCSTRKQVEVSAEQKLADTFVSYENTYHDVDPFSKVGAAAINKLTDGAYVYLNETVNATSDMAGTMVDAGEKLINQEDYDEQMLKNWEYLITQMLVRNPDYGYGNEQNQLRLDARASNFLSYVDEVRSQYQWLVDSGFIHSTEDVMKIFDSALESMRNEKAILEAAIKNGTATDVQIQMFNSLDKQFMEMTNKRRNVGDLNAVGEGAGELLDAAIFVFDGINAYNNAADTQNVYRQMGTYYNASIEKLNSIIAAAETVGASDIVVAAQRVKMNLNTQMRKTAEELEGERVLAAGDQMLKAGTTMLLEELCNYAPVLNGISLIGQGVDFALQWGDSYESAKTMMLLRDMDNLLGDKVERAMALDPNTAYYFAELYNVLQIEGLNQAKEFLKDYENGNGLSVSDFGIGNLNQYLNTINSCINSRIANQEYMYILYGNSLQENAASRKTETDVPQEKRTEKRYCTVKTGSGKNVRSGAGIEYSVVTFVSPGERFPILDSKKASDGKVWYLINGNGITGWISSGVVTLD